MNAASSSEQTGNDAASSRTESTRALTTRRNRPPRSRSLLFELLKSRELLSQAQPLNADVAPTWNAAPQTPAAVPSDIVAPLALAPEPASTQEAEESAASDASQTSGDESVEHKGRYYNAHDLNDAY